ncbi:MAG: hypothetical protein HY763_04670 [Planctomycetes bacterium]|nr:hypothetical protein [Planctomycetota bacterium]
MAFALYREDSHPTRGLPWPGFGAAALGLALMLLGVRCVPSVIPPAGDAGDVGDVGDGGDGDADDDSASPYMNTTDATNKSASYIGADACRVCHTGISEQHRVHGHAHKLQAVQGEPPVFPAEGTRAGVPDPPEGYTWEDISYVIGGYTKKGRFIDQQGFILTTGLTEVNTQWNLSYPANGTTPGFVAYEPDAETPKPYDFSCFVCHTTGAKPQDEDFPEFQENRPGFIGTWEEPSVQCEECHGPGSNHFRTLGNQVEVDTSRIFVNTAASACGKCHTRGTDPVVIIAKGGFIQHHEQWPELQSSGGHAAFDCTTCHDPHVSVNYDRANGIRNECTACHTDQNMALHEGLTYERGDYREPVSCESCHMPFATKSAAAASADVVGDVGRMGDTRTHIFRINTSAADFNGMFSGDGNTVVRDEQGRAAVTIDFVCFRCHNGIGSAPAFSSMQVAADVASAIHDIMRR